MSIPVPPGRASETIVNVRFTYDINGLLEVEAHIPQTGERRELLIMDDETRISADEVQRRRESLAKLKVHPRDDDTNRALIARGERCYEQALGERREFISRCLSFATVTKAGICAPSSMHARNSAGAGQPTVRHFRRQARFRVLGIGATTDLREIRRAARRLVTHQATRAGSGTALRHEQAMRRGAKLVASAAKSLSRLHLHLHLAPVAARLPRRPPGSTRTCVASGRSARSETATRRARSSRPESRAHRLLKSPAIAHETSNAWNFRSCNARAHSPQRSPVVRGRHRLSGTSAKANPLPMAARLPTERLGDFRVRCSIKINDRTARISAADN
jgi:hypothetical protein